MPVSKWNHSICVDCWNKRNPNQEPFRFKPEFTHEDICCFCGDRHISGIFVRHDPTDPRLVCKGEHQ